MKKKLKEYEWSILLFGWGMFGVISAIYVWAYYAAMG